MIVSQRNDATLARVFNSEQTDGGSTKQPAAVLRARTAGWTVALRCIQQTGSRIRIPIPKGDRQLW